MKPSGSMTHRNRQSSAPDQHGGGGGSNNNYESDEEMAKKTALSTGSLWVRRQRAFLHPQCRLVMMVLMVGVLCLAFTMFRSSAPSVPSYSDLVAYANRAKVHPRCVRYANDLDHATDTLFLEPNIEHYPSYREIDRPMSDPETQEGLADSADYRHGRVEEFETKACKAQYPWQLTSFPTCNTVYEFDLTNVFDRETGVAKAKLMANGFWRDVWSVKEEGSGEKRVLKTMRYVHDYSEFGLTLQLFVWLSVATVCSIAEATATYTIALFLFQHLEITTGTDGTPWPWNA